MRTQALYFSSLLVTILACGQGSDKPQSKEGDIMVESAMDNSQPAITEASARLPMEKIKLPDGFKVSVYAEVDNARSLAISPSGIV